ncbi:hypothetical protein [Phormidesmis priestleyi]|uniref:hypothetical protein n=1 Tax=Phormidesmis priestleyi TaxID=268141 RepID=UPI0012E95616|nr:hypothetical protein [Phormidesmis priestleyi]
MNNRGVPSQPRYREFDTIATLDNEFTRPRRDVSVERLSEFAMTHNLLVKNKIDIDKHKFPYHSPEEPSKIFLYDRQSH